jgi:hypothetical protein
MNGNKKKKSLVRGSTGSSCCWECDTSTRPLSFTLFFFLTGYTSVTAAGETRNDLMKEMNNSRDLNLYLLEHGGAWSGALDPSAKEDWCNKVQIHTAILKAEWYVVIGAP